MSLASMDSLETVAYESHDEIAKVMMNRPDKRNAQNIRMLEELDAALHHADSDPDVHVIILGGVGVAFCGGHDLAENVDDSVMSSWRSRPYGTFDFERKYYFDKCLAWRDLNTPTVAMVQGACMSGGMMTAAMCDLIIAADDARFSDPVLGMAFDERGHPRPASLLGTPAIHGAAAVEVLFHPWQMTARKAKEFLFTGEWMSADQALACGFVNRVIPLALLEDETFALCRKIAAMKPRAVSETKRSINRMLDLQGQRDAYEYHFLIHEMFHGA